jgi:Ca-activated chloride channel family protein
VVDLPRRAVIVLALVSCGAAQVATQAPAFSSRVEAVRVDVLVTDEGHPVLGLQPQDFEIFDNGVAQKVDLASFEKIPLNVILALDMSASLEGDRLEHLRKAGEVLLDGLNATDRAALLTFSHLLVQPSQLTADIGRVRAGLKNAQGSGLTSLIDASHAGIMTAESDVGRSLLIVFSDGVDTASWLSPEAVLETAKRCDVVVYAVEVGGFRARFLRDLSGATGGRLIEIESARNLAATFRAILDEFRMRYLISYSPEGVTSGGWHRLDVRVKSRTASVKARPGYLSGF